MSRVWAGAAVAAALALLTACGKVKAEQSDASVPDATPPPAVLRDGLWYVMDAILLPANASQATMFAVDLDGDDQPDNALGALLAAMNGQADLEIAMDQTDAVEDGRILALVGIDADSLDDVAAVPVQVARGSDLDGDASDNFSGTEPFALDPLEGADGQLDGSVTAGQLQAGPGTVPIQLAIFGVTPQVIALRGFGGRIGALASVDGLTVGRLAGAFTEEEVDTVLIPKMAAGVDSIVRRDCPGGTCTADSPGDQLSAVFDEDQDGRVMEEEFSGSALIQSTVGTPDLDLFDADGRFNPGIDGVKDSLSFGVAFTAVGAGVIE